MFSNVMTVNAILTANNFNLWLVTTFATYMGIHKNHFEFNVNLSLKSHKSSTLYNFTSSSNAFLAFSLQNVNINTNSQPSMVEHWYMIFPSLCLRLDVVRMHIGFNNNHRNMRRKMMREE